MLLYLLLCFPECRIVDLSQLLGKLLIPATSPQSFETNELPIIGEGTIWGRSLRISGKKKTTCGAIHAS